MESGVIDLGKLDACRDQLLAQVPGQIPTLSPEDSSLFTLIGERLMKEAEVSPDDMQKSEIVGAIGRVLRIGYGLARLDADAGVERDADVDPCDHCKAVREALEAGCDELFAQLIERIPMLGEEDTILFIMIGARIMREAGVPVTDALKYKVSHAVKTALLVGYGLARLDVDSGVERDIDRLLD